MTATPTVTAVVVAFGHTPLLVTCVERLLASSDVDIEVVVVDNGSTDGSIDEVRDLERVVIVSPGANLGFGGGCNEGASRASGKYLVFCNPDALFAREAVATLIGALEADSTVGIASAKIRLLDEPHLLNSRGNAIHFLGLGWSEGYREPVATATGDADVAAASGAGMAMRTRNFLDVGGFARELFLYHEDAELSWRCWLHGWRVRFVADAVVDHKYEFSRNAKKMYYLERNRLVWVVTAYEATTLAVLAPALLALEVGMLALAIAQGWGREKISGWAWCGRNARWIASRRKELQSNRTKGDVELFPLLAHRFTAGQVEMPPAVRPVDRLLAFYWRAAQRVLR